MFSGIISFFKEVKGELVKVTWPKRNEVIRLTLIVLVISTIIGAYLGGLDYLLTKLFEIVLVK
ncbi:MAG: preprotein translocase subunit SecE [Patescibacteria group bacterium]